jgi:hypothetical protein
MGSVVSVMPTENCSLLESLSISAIIPLQEIPNGEIEFLSLSKGSDVGPSTDRRRWDMLWSEVLLDCLGRGMQTV